jgi:hypothetical protein
VSVTGLHAPSSSPGAETAALTGRAGEPFVWDEEESEALRRARKDAEGDVSPDSVRAYLKQIGKVALLNAEREVELAERIEAGLYATERLCATPKDIAAGSARLCRDLNWIVRDGQRAKNHLVEANLRLVVSMAKRYTGRGMGFLDLIQEGNLGLIRTARQQDQSEYLLEDQIQQPQRHCGDHARPLGSANHRWSAACAMFWNPKGPPGRARDADRFRDRPRWRDTWPAHRPIRGRAGDAITPMGRRARRIDVRRLEQARRQEVRQMGGGGPGDRSSL